MQIGQWLGGDEVVTFLKLSVGFAGKAYHDICADGGIGRGTAHDRQSLRVVPWSIAAVHAPQNSIRSGLQRHVDMPGEAGECGRSPVSQ